jgi:hypothetical protein
MTPLEFDQKRFVNRCVVRARARERQHFAAEVEALRAMRDEMQAKAESLEAQLAALSKALSDVQQEAKLLQEWFAAHTDRHRAKAELAALLRQQEAWAEAEYDPIASTRH